MTPWLSRCFRSVSVVPLDEAKTVKALYGRKERYEKFHAVSYTDDAILSAVEYSRMYFPDSPLVAKAAEILDMSGSRVKLRQTALPDEVMEIQKRIKFIVHRMENAIANHEFEKARHYSDEERKGNARRCVLSAKNSILVSLTRASLADKISQM